MGHALRAARHGRADGLAPMAAITVFLVLAAASPQFLVWLLPFAGSPPPTANVS
jgi:hypothetical protein